MSGTGVNCGEFHLEGTWLDGAYEHQSESGTLFRYEEAGPGFGTATVKYGGSTLENEDVASRDAARDVFARHEDLW